MKGSISKYTNIQVKLGVNVKNETTIINRTKLTGSNLAPEERIKTYKL